MGKRVSYVQQPPNNIQTYHYRAKRITVPVIPDDIIVSILSKLDIRDACRFRCVCRRWKDLTSDEHFTNSLPSCSTPVIYADFRMTTCDEIDSHYLLDRWWEAAPRRIKCSSPAYRIGDNYWDLYAQGSQNGFIFLNYGSVFSIINPINREEVRIILPKSISTTILGIFLHPITREYCTIWHESGSFNGIPKIEYKMLNLGTQPCWRAIKYPFFSAMVLDSSAVFVEDFFYWMVRPYKAYMCNSGNLKEISIMAFDIKTEELSLMPLPHDCTRKYNGQSHPTIHNVDGFLSIGKTNYDEEKIMVKIWTLTDRERKLWTSSNYVFNCINHLKNPSMIEIIGEQVLFSLPGTRNEFLVGSLKHGTLSKFVCNSNCDNRWLRCVLFHKPSLASLKKCKPLIRLDQENEKEEELMEYESSSCTDLNILVEDITDYEI